MSDPRPLILAAMQSVVGLTANDPRFLTLIAPGDTPEAQAQIALESDCFLVGLGVQELVFQLLARGPYKNGSAPELMEERCAGSPMSPAGAIRLAGQESPPAPADAVWYGESAFLKAEHFEHVLAIDTVMGTADYRLTCVAGGEKNSGGLQTVTIMFRRIAWDGRNWLDRANGRPIIAVVDADLLAGLYPLLPCSTGS